MKKTITAILSLLMIVGIMAFVGCSGCDGCGCGSKKSKKSSNAYEFKTLTLNEDYLYVAVHSDVTSFSFADEIKTNNKTTFTVSTDEMRDQHISDKVVDLEYGNNAFYLVISSEGKEIAAYRAVIRRKPLFSVTFNTNGGSMVSVQIVEEGELASEPTTTYSGYTFVKWDYDFSMPIYEDVLVSASWRANTNTPYVVNYWLQNLDNDEYHLEETANCTGMTGATASAQIKNYTNYEVTQSIVSGVINGDGSTALNVYYNIKQISVDVYVYVDSNLQPKKTLSCKYGASLSQLYSPLGYNCSWSDGNNSLSSDYIASESETYTVYLDEKDEMIPFYFESDNKNCKITGLKYPDSTQIVIPDYVTELGSNSISSVNIINLTIGKGIKHIDNNAFYDSYNLQKVYYNGTPTEWSQIQGIMYLTDKDFTLYFEEVALTDITIENVESIMPYAFYKRENLVSVTIGEGVKNISESAFENCLGLTNVQMGKDVAFLGENAFTNCFSLDNVDYNGTPAEWSQIEGLESLMVNGLTLTFKGDSLSCLMLLGIDEIKAYAFYFKPVDTENQEETDQQSNSSSNDKSSSNSSSSNSSANSSSSSNSKGNSSSSSNNNSSSSSNNAGNSSSTTSTSSSNVSNSNEENPQQGNYVYNYVTTVILDNSVTIIGEYAFYGCNGLEKVYYKGTRAQFEQIDVSVGNACFNNADVYYYSAEEPTDTTLSYWHFGIDGETPVEW